MSEIEVKGLREFQSALVKIAEEYSEKDARRTLQFAMRRTLYTVRDEVIREVPYDAEGDNIHIRDNVSVAMAKKRDTKPGHIMMKVGIRSRAKQYVNNKKNRREGRVGGIYKDYGLLYYARIVEFGSRDTPPNRFMTRSWARASPRLPELIKAELTASIERTLKRLKK